MPGGRPTDYTPELAEKICHLIATHPYGIKKICSMYDDIPSHQTVSNWIANNSQFFGQYLESKEKQAHAITEQLQDDLCELQPIQEEIALFNVKYRYYQWHLSKLAPKQFGDKQKDEDNTQQIKSAVKEALEPLIKKHEKDY